jgi:hypothetical protein
MPVSCADGTFTRQAGRQVVADDHQLTGKNSGL